MHVSEQFYKGELRTDGEIIALLQDATNVNLMGKHAIALAIQAGIIERGNVRRIKGVPHAQTATC